MLLEAGAFFIIPSSVLVNALGTSSTEPMKVAVSIIGLVTALAWCYGTLELAAPGKLGEALLCLPYFFAMLWFVSFFVHSWLWRKMKRKKTAL